MQKEADEQYEKLLSMGLTQREIDNSMAPLLGFFLMNYDEEIRPKTRA